ncbi:MAG: hypothetical protein ABI655_05995 [Phenylobacterium sp.]
MNRPDHPLSDLRRHAQQLIAGNALALDQLVGPRRASLSADQERPPSQNPLLSSPPTDVIGRPAILDDLHVDPRTSVDAMARRQGLIGEGHSGAHGDVLTAAERLALARTPKRPPGTEVSVEAYPVHKVGDRADHMYVQYDDGREQLIARGGPSKEGAGFAAGILDGETRVNGGVSPAKHSLDYGQGQRVLFRGFLPGVSAQDAAESARLHANGINRGGNPYGLALNSNSFAADVIEDKFGRRVGDSRTWGFENRLNERSPRPPLDLSPLFGLPTY